MRVLVIGAGKLGAQVIRQLRKNPQIEIIVADGHENPFALRERIVSAIDLVMHITPLNFQEALERAEPDLVVLARTSEDWDQRDVPMGAEYVSGMERELTKMAVAVLPVCERVFGQ